MTTVSQAGSPRPVTPVGILALMLEQLVGRVSELDVDDSWLSDLRAASELAAGLDPYLDRWTTPESTALRKLVERTEAADWSRPAGPDAGAPLEQEMLSGHVEGQLLKMLVHATRARRVLEIGMFTGYSALAMAEALPDGGQVVACEIDPGVAAFARDCFAESEVGDRIEIRVGDARGTLSQLAAAGDSFELVFVDADKAGYLDYVTDVLDTGLLAPHGLICVDNTLMQGQPWLTGETTPNGAAIAEFNEAVAADPRVEQVIIALRDGVTLIRRVEGS